MSVSLPSFPLRKKRVHEATGAGASAFAAAVCAQLDGPVIWVVEGWKPEKLNPVGFGAFTDPLRLLVATAPSPDDVLAVAEEALRDGAAPIVVIEITRPLGLTAGRRLQLAAETGRTTGLCLIPEGMGSNAAESRWSCTPIHDTSPMVDSTLMRWEIIKNKSGTLGVWDVRWHSATRRLSVVPPARK